MKYCRNDWPDKIFFSKEYFSKNDIRFTPHWIVPKNEKWTFERAFHWSIIGDTGAWKTFFANHLIRQILKDKNTQIIYLDPVMFESQNLVKKVWEWKWNIIVDKNWNVIKVEEWKWDHIKNVDYFSFEMFKTPVNIIWYLSDDEVERKIKITILFNIIFWELDLEKEDVSFIKKLIEIFIIDNEWKYFNYSKFKEFFIKEILNLQETKIVLYQTLVNSLKLWDRIEKILSLENDLLDIVENQQFVLFNVKNLFDTNNFLMIRTVFELIKYVSKKNVSKFKYVFFDEVRKVIQSAEEYGFKETLINWFDEALRTLRQFNWIVMLITQLYEDLVEYGLLSGVNLSIVLDEKNASQMLVDKKYENDKVIKKYLEDYISILKENATNKNNQKRIWLLFFTLWNNTEAMIMDTTNIKI